MTVVKKTATHRISREGDYATLEMVGTGDKVRVHISEIPKLVKKLRAAAVAGETVIIRQRCV